ncbi:hypothetical protein JCM15579A_19160 [Marinifilum fragile]
MKVQRKHIRIIGLTLIFISIALIFREALQYNELPSMEDPICQVVDFFKYKENAVSNGIIWIGLLILGLILYLKKWKE